MSAAFFGGVAYAGASFAAMLAFILLDGLWTTRVYRHGGLHRQLARAAPGVDPLLAMATTFCGCMTQAPVATWAQAGEEPRAVRWLLWTSTLRPMALIGLALLSPMAAAIFSGLALLYGGLGGRLLGKISPGATFLVRRPGNLGDWIGDSVRETGMMVTAYGAALLICAVLGGSVWAMTQGSPPPRAAWPALTGVLGVLGVFVPVDLLAAMPVLVALGLGGAPPALVAGLGAGALTCSRRADRLVRGYLRTEVYSRQRAYARSFPVVLTLLVAALT